MAHDKKNQGMVDKVYGFAKRQASDIKTGMKQFRVFQDASASMKNAMEKAKAKAKGR